MAKLSVYNTIDRSQLGGKFVPLIQSGVNNYKILASDLGKEYSPGDAIEITDTGVINVKFRPDDFDVSSGSLTIKTDESRGVFKGSDGIYIASADSTINVSVSGIKVNRSNLVSRISGAGLKAVGEMIDVNPADDTIDVGMDGIRVNTSALSIPNAHSLAGSGLESVDSNTLYVKSANDSISVSPAGIKVNTSFLAGRYLRSDSNHGMTVDTAPLAHAITGSGLVETNGLIGVNVNTATGLIINNNELYLNAGAGLHTTNNSVRVKTDNNSIGISGGGICVRVADHSIGLGHYGIYVRTHDSTIISNHGIRVNTGYGLSATVDGLYVKSANKSIGVNGEGIKVNLGSGMRMHSDGIMVGELDASIGVEATGIRVRKDNDTLKLRDTGLYVDTAYVSGAIAGEGLDAGDTSGKMNVKAADSSIYVYSGGVSVRVKEGGGILSGSEGLYFDSGAITLPSASSLSGDGLYSYNNALYVHAADNTIFVGSNGIKVNYGLSLTKDTYGRLDTALYAGSGVKLRDNYISAYAGSGLKIDDDGMLVSALYAGSGAKLESNYISLHTGDGLEINGTGAVYVKSSDNTISVSSKGIKVHTAWLAGHGLSATIHSLYVQPADGFIKVASTGVGLHYHNLLSSLTNEYSGSANIKSAGSYLYTAIGDGLRLGSNSAIYVKSADNTVDVSSSGIKVNTSALSIPDANSLAGNGLHSVNGSALYVKSADNTIDVSYAGIKVNNLEPLLGLGLEWSGAQAAYVKSADHSIGVSASGVYVNSGRGLTISNNKLELKLHESSSIGFNSEGYLYSLSGSGYSDPGIDVYLVSGAAEASAAGDGGIAIGYASTSTQIGAIAIGHSAHARGSSSLAVGVDSLSSADRCISIGPWSAVNGLGGIGIGSSSKAHMGVAVGHNAGTSDGVAIGESAKSSSLDVAVGAAAQSDYRGVAVGHSSYSRSGATAVGASAFASSGAVSVGSSSNAGFLGLSIGNQSHCSDYATAIGAGAVSNGTYCLSAGYMSSATGTESVALGVNSDASSFGIAIGSQSNASQYGLAIGYNASALDGMVSIRTSHSDGRCFDYKYDCEGKLYATDSSGGTYTRSWENLLTPPNYSTAVSINTNTEYTADRPAYIAFNVYAGGTSGYVVAFIKNNVAVFNVGVLYGLTIYNIIPVAKGDTYKLNITDYGATNPQVYAYRIYPR